MYHTDFVCVTDAKNFDYAALQGMNISVGCKLVGFADLDTQTPGRLMICRLVYLLVCN